MTWSTLVSIAFAQFSGNRVLTTGIAAFIISEIKSQCLFYFIKHMLTCFHQGLKLHAPVAVAVESKGVDLHPSNNERELCMEGRGGRKGKPALEGEKSSRRI